jgi:hypothetical protein
VTTNHRYRVALGDTRTRVKITGPAGVVAEEPVPEAVFDGYGPLMTVVLGMLLELGVSEVDDGEMLRQDVAVANGEARRLGVDKQDRLTRSFVDFVLITQDALKRWALVALDSPDLDPTTPDGELMVNMRAVFARYEQRRISERIKAALAVKKSQGSGWAHRA